MGNGERLDISWHGMESDQPIVINDLMASLYAHRYVPLEMGKQLYNNNNIILTFQKFWIRSSEVLYVNRVHRTTYYKIR